LPPASRPCQAWHGLIATFRTTASRREPAVEARAGLGEPRRLAPGACQGGIGVSATYYGEAFANSGGFKQGGKYDGVLDVAIDADLHKLGFWKGLCFHTNGFQIHGQSITASNIGSLMPVSSLEATPNTRCSSFGSSSICSATSSR
jgi:carbohydrate-selective porin OprB